VANGAEPVGLYPRLLGPSWLQLAEAVRAVHAAESAACHGRLRIGRGSGAVARLLAKVLKLPRASAAAETRLIVTPQHQAEHWRRIFDGRCLTTRQYPAGDGELAERIGMLEFRFRLEPSDGGLVFRQVGAAVVLGTRSVPVPSAFAPTIEAREDAVGPRQIRVHVRVVLPVAGPLLTYDGIVDVDGPEA
jgi:hypothetical protein